MFDPTIALAGLGVGFLVGLTGMGGGALMTPLLIFIFGVPPAAAVATDRFKSTITKAAAAAQHLRQGTVDLKATSLLLKGSLPGALVGGGVLLWVGREGARAVDAFVLPALGLTLILAAGGIFLGGRLLHRPFGEEEVRQTPRRQRALVWGGAAVGFILTLTSVGAGSLVIVLLGFLRLVPGRRLVGTDLFHGFILVAAATGLHAWLGHIDFLLAANVLVGSVPGAVLGGRLCASAPLPVLRPILALTVLASGVGFLM